MRRAGLNIGLIILLLAVSNRIYSQFEAGLLKAAYLERITRFVEWPETVVIKDTSIFIIGVYQDEAFARTLEKAFHDKQIRNHPVRIIAIEDPESVIKCHLCYLSVRNTDLIRKIIETANLNGVFLVSDFRGAGIAGTHINFYIEDEKLKFEVNKSSVDKGKFRISSVLLKSSKII